MEKALRSVPWTVREALAVFLVPWIILPVVFIVGLELIAPAAHWAQHFLQAFENEDPKVSFALVAVDALGSLLLIRHYLRRHTASWRDLGLRGFNLWRALGTIALIYAVFFVAVGLLLALVTALVPGFNPDQAQTNEFTNVAPQFRPLALLALVIVPPLVEEPVFRGFMFPAFAKRFGLIGGAIISSLLFGFAHLQANIFVYTLVLGLLLCFLYVRTRSIIPGIFLHMINNYIAFLALYQQ